MRGNRGADIWPGAMHDIEHAVWQTGLTRNLAQHESGHRCQLARLRDGRVADGNCGRDFPAQQIKRKIPWRNQARDAAWLAQRVVERDVVGDVRFRFGVENRRREKTEIAGRAWNVERARERHWFARVDRLSVCELFQIPLDQVGDAQENVRPLRRWCSRPIRERLFGRGHRKIDVPRVAVCDLRIGLSRGRLDVVEVPPAYWLNELAVDEAANLE